MTDKTPPVTSAQTSRADDMFPTLTAAQVARIAAHGRVRQVQRGDVLVKAGQLTARFFVVINEDFVAPAQGFGTHSHRDMEILSYVVAGQLAHKDSTGTSEVIRPGEVQRMTAGTGVSHSEFNPSDSEPTHFLQIWIAPEQEGLKPGYEQREFPEAQRRGKLRLVASRNGSDGSVTIHQDVKLYGALLAAREEVSYQLDGDRYAWIQVVKGAVTVNGTALGMSDGAAISEEAALTIVASKGAEILIFDLP